MNRWFPYYMFTVSKHVYLRLMLTKETQENKETVKVDPTKHKCHHPVHHMDAHLWNSECACGFKITTDTEWAANASIVMHRLDPLLESKTVCDLSMFTFKKFSMLPKEDDHGSYPTKLRQYVMKHTISAIRRASKNGNHDDLDRLCHSLATDLDYEFKER